MSLPTLHFNPALRNAAFESIAGSPGTWVLTALELKVAADRIDYFRIPVRDDEACLSLITVYRFLVGLSRENLLKSMLAVQGEPVLTDGGLSPRFATHKLTKLASMIATSAFTFSSTDVEILARLEPFIVWAGRYPIPKSENELIVKGGSSSEYDAERDLWSRMYGSLLAIAWFQKPEGRKLYLNGKVAP